ncbi:hypothetical protein [Luteolibacter soli]|uniref:Lipoprotein n=1 Tax=Luteolibacter soli TaxID=3135280 RepID=A0ABU9AQP3_9BACT
MKAPLRKLAAQAVLAGVTALSVGCYPAYPPGSAYNTSASGYAPDAKGYNVPYSDSAPQQPAPPPGRYGVDPALVVAGAAAVGLLGYAIGSHHHHDYYYAPGPYRYGPGYYGPRCYPY